MVSESSARSLGSVLRGGIRHGLYRPLSDFGGGTRVLKMGLQYSEERIGSQPMPRVHLSDAEITRFRACQGDLLFARTSMMSDGAGKCSQVVAHDEPFVFDGNILCCTPDTDVVDPSFIYYFFKAPPGRQAIAEIIAGTQSRSLSGTSLAAVPIPCPPLSHQRAVASILGGLDDKIETNRRISETLEVMARAQFQSWFVDFDPVRAKAEGRDPGLPKHIANLFPDSFEESELGEIPNGWAAGTLGDVSILNPEAWTKDTRPARLRYVDLSNTKWGRIEAITEFPAADAPSRAQRVLRPADTIVGTVRPGNGSYALVSETGLTGSTGFAVLRPKSPTQTEFVYLAATSAENIEALAHLADGGAYPAVRPEIVAATPVVRPPIEIFDRFSLAMAPLHTRIAQCQRESRTLRTLRDALLPKLISGDLRMGAAETRSKRSMV